MKRYLLVLLILCAYLNGFSISDRIKLGIFAAPGVSWMKPMGNEIHNGVAGFGLQYGIKVEYYFKDQNYAIATGLYGGIGDGGLRGRDTLTRLNNGKSVLEKYNTNNLILPAYLKLKTNPFKDRFRLFGEVGFQLVFNVSARANYDQSVPSTATGNPLVSVVKENVLQNGNAVQQLIPDFRYQIFDFRLSVGGGAEYEINDKTSVFFAIHYNNGFISTVNDKSVNPKHDPTVVRNVLFTLGAMF
jgi:hypothetical protein